MESETLLTSLLGPVLYATPHLLLSTIGLVLCLMRRRTLGAAGIYACAGFALFILGSLFGLGAHVWLIWMSQNGQATSSLTLVMSVFSGVATVLHAVAMGLVIAAILIRRPAQAA
ncbi:MAG: hypothetical protein HOQ32_04095 [Lysobacter sp.]|nr:hypothetical protein [Lysobacter sp.]